MLVRGPEPLRGASSSSPTGGRCSSLGVFSPDRTPTPSQETTPVAAPRVAVAACQCDGGLVPSAGRQSVCPRCELPVVRWLVETAEDVLDRETRRGRVAPFSLLVECGRCGDDLDGRMIAVRDYDDRFGEYFDTVVEDVRGDGDGPTVTGCDVCDRQLATDVVAARERVVA